MRVFSQSTLRRYWEANADAEVPLRDWFRATAQATWANPNEVKEYASNISLLSNERVCFNIKGNKYRLVVAIDYIKQYLYIKFVGTHAEYSKIDAETVEFGEVAR